MAMAIRFTLLYVILFLCCYLLTRYAEHSGRQYGEVEWTIDESNREFLIVSKEEE